PMGAALPAPVVNGELAASTPTEVQERLRQQDDENAVISVGDDVFTADGEKVGEVENIVFDSVTGMPTHLTVRRGWLFHRDWELDADVIASVDDGQVTLKLNRGHLQARQEEQKYAAEGSPTAGPAARR
ncbi:MAG TPA: PRC-barrel domain-containing protein, partial [Chthonomonadaceae bacterium]|nr:PRC-barrel domain-containing protein [Chthonomonadaceae bacterium]